MTIDLEKKIAQINPGSSAPDFRNGITLHRIAIEAQDLICDINSLK